MNKNGYNIEVGVQFVFFRPGDRSGHGKTRWCRARQSIVVMSLRSVAINKSTGRSGSRGARAQEMLGRTPGNLGWLSPMKDGRDRGFQSYRKNADVFYSESAQPGACWCIRGL